MANVKISQLPTATTLTAADLLPIVQGGVTKQVTPDLLPVSTATATALAGKDAAGAATAAQAAAVQRANHTGTQSADTITDGTTNKAYTATERTKLAGIATGATANRADAATDTLLAAKADLVAGVIPTSQIPAIALTNAVTVASQAAMLALTTTQVQPGDVAVRTDGAGTFILTATDPTVLGNWVRLNAPTDAVTTVNGQSGTVVLTAANVGADAAGAAAAITPTSLGLGNVTNTSDTAKPVSTAQATALANVTISLPVNVMSANGTAVIGARNAVNASAGPVAVTMPTPTAVGQHLIIERSDASAVTANAITITGTIRGTPGTVVTLAAVGAANEGALYISESLTSWVVAGSIKPRAVLDAAYDAKGTAAGLIANVISIVDNGDGTVTLTGPGIVDNGDGTVSFNSAAGKLVYTKTQTDTLLAAKAALASPAFTGTPTAPTPATADNSTTIATTAYVKAQGAGGGTAVNVQVFEASGTWTKPAGVTTVQVTLVAGGCGGGSGRRTASGVAGSGGGGGAGGPGEFRVFPASSLPATVAVTVGGGGAGGAAVTVDSTNGNAGTAGGNTFFGSYARVNAASAGGGGGTTAGTAGGGNNNAMYSSGGGAAGGLGAAGSTAGSAATGASGGGGGGGISTTPAAFAGGGGGFSLDSNSNVAGGAINTAGTAGTDAASGIVNVALGGGGGGASITAAGGAGGNGGKYGAGGGGGGASLNGSNSGAGGAGGGGVVVVTAW